MSQQMRRRRHKTMHCKWRRFSVEWWQRDEGQYSHRSAIVPGMGRFPSFSIGPAPLFIDGLRIQEHTHG